VRPADFIIIFRSRGLLATNTSQHPKNRASPTYGALYSDLTKGSGKDKTGLTGVGDNGRGSEESPGARRRGGREEGDGRGEERLDKPETKRERNGMAYGPRVIA
jgi:hypothetical protein